MNRFIPVLLILVATATLGEHGARADDNVIRKLGKDAAQAGKQIGKAGKNAGKDIGRAGKKIGKGIRESSRELFRD
ncbi:MAG TPA: hypothetical protein VMW70_04400 [Burkholderiales bacterium]|nr:hypothetical protein [Burkholderiales bacterium]